MDWQRPQASAPLAIIQAHPTGACERSVRGESSISRFESNEDSPENLNFPRQIILSCWGELPEERQTFQWMERRFRELIPREELESAQQAAAEERRSYDVARNTLEQGGNSVDLVRCFLFWLLFGLIFEPGLGPRVNIGVDSMIWGVHTCILLNGILRQFLVKTEANFLTEKSH